MDNYYWHYIFSIVRLRTTKFYQRMTAILETQVFKLVILYAVFPVTILADILLIPILIVLQNNLVFVLVVNSYLNASSVALGSIILRQQIAQESQAKDHQEEIRTLHANQHAERNRLHQEILSAIPPSV